MKQNITLKQLRELTENQKEKLKNWYEKCKGVPFIDTTEVWADDKFLPQLSIGKMIQFIQENIGTDWSIHFGKDLAFVGRSDKDGFHGQTPENPDGELCDGLWEIVRQILNES